MHQQSFDFPKFRAFRTPVPYVVPKCLTYLHALRAYVPSCLKLLRAYVPMCLKLLRAYVSTCLRDLSYYVSTCLRAYVLLFFTCYIFLHANIYFLLLLTFVPSIISYLLVLIFDVFTCLTK